MTPRFLAVLAAAALAASVSTAAFAQGAHDDLAKKEALANYREGIELADHGDYEKARLKFVEAYAVIANSDLLYNLAVCEMKTNRKPEASSHFRRMLADAATRPAYRERAKAMLARIAPDLAHVAVAAPAGEDVSVDGKLVGRAPLGDVVDVEPGVHVYSILAHDGHHVEVRQTAVAGEDERVELALEQAPASSSGRGSSSSANTNQASPSHGGSEHGSSNAIPPETMATHRMFLPPTEALVLGGVGLVGLAFGIGFGVDSSNHNSNAETLAKTLNGQCAGGAQTAGCDALRSERSSAQTSAIVSTITYAAGGAALAAGVLWWAIAPRTERFMMTPHVSPTGFGAELLWNF